MTKTQKESEKKLYRKRLKELNAGPRSDWHREFEDILQIDIDSWNNNAHINREVAIGEDAPRSDYIVVSPGKMPERVKEIFKTFLGENLVEYKRPDELLTERMLWKTAGYGAMLIGTTRETQYRIDDLTLTLFVMKKNEELFNRLEKRGILLKTEASGIYRVEKLSALPYQVIVAEELEGEDYAAYRALREHAKASDVEAVLNKMKTEQGEIRDRYYRILNLIEIKNPGTVAEMIQEDAKVKNVFLEVLKPEIDEMNLQSFLNGKNDGYLSGKNDGYLSGKNDGYLSGKNDGIEEALQATVERLITKGADGATIKFVTGYDRSRIDEIAKNLHQEVKWSEAVS